MQHSPEDISIIETVMRRFLPSDPLIVERMMEGMSTWVYRVIAGQETLYLRVLPEEGASFAPEAALHEALRVRGVKVPAVLYVEPYNKALQRSIMVTSEVKGQPVSQSSALGADCVRPGRSSAHSRLNIGMRT